MANSCLASSINAALSGVNSARGSKSIQSKVDSILQDVERFTDIEKLYLYLRLPSGPSGGSEKNEQSCVSSSRVQQMHAFSWIRNHLEEHPETSLPKQEVYDEYKNYCDNLGYHALSAADFGKIMKNVFPNMKARRLGMRGKSKYCYSGLRKKPFIHMPSLPNLDVHKTGDGCEVFEPAGQSSGGEDEVRSAACDLVCEWAHKVLSREFDSVEDLARFLLNSHYISTKSVAALTVMTGSPSGAMMSVQSSAFVPTTDAHSFQPQVKTLASPSVDAKQQLQRKIQQKQQEQKLRSPLPAEAHTRRADGGSTPGASTGVSCGSPALLSPQPTIGIVVAAVPSPVTVQRSRPLMSPSPVPIAPAESKVLPVHFQVVAQTVQPVNRCPKTPQNVPASPVGDRLARPRYPQILPKPATTSSITLRSPPALLIAKSSKTLAPKDSPVGLFKMTAISLGPSGTATVDTMTTSNTARPASAGIASLNDDLQPVPRARSGSVAAMPSALAKPGETDAVPASSTELDAVEAGQSQGGSATREAGVGIQLEGALKPRAASVPTPLSKISAGLDVQTGTKCTRTMLFNNNNLAAGSNNVPTLYQGKPNPTTSSAPTPRDAELASACHRKREGLYPDSSPIPVKKVFISEGRDGVQLNVGVAVKSIPRADPIRPESAPASAAGKVMLGMSSAVPSRNLAVFDAPVGNNGFQTVGRPQGVPREGWEASSSCAAAGNAHGQNPQVRNASFQTFSRPRSVSQGQWESALASKPAGTRAVSAPGQALLQQHASIQAMQRGLDEPGSLAACWDREQRDGAQQGTVQHKHEPAAIPQAPAPEMAEYVSSQPLVGYFPFNEDDMTQDSIVEELVQMEEQMKSSMQDLGGCGSVSLQSQQAPLQKMMSTPCQTSASYYNSAHSGSSTSIDTPSYSTDVLGGGQGLTRESPCSRFAPTTPVDSALGSSCQTPIGTPHSNCSSSIPPSPVECRNPFAFTPINSNVPGYHDGSIVSSSPVKPMQRPMATHPDKAKLEWMNNGSSSSNGISILPNYQNLVDDQFRKPHAFAIPGQSPVRHHDVYNHRLTPISPVQQQVASMANLNKQEGFAVPAPLDNKASTSSSGSGTFRCRSVSPAVRQRKLSGTPNPNVARYLASPFNSPVTPEVLNIFAGSQTDANASSMAQRSQSVPLNVMMQTEVLPMQAGGQSGSGKTITSVLLSKMDGDGDVFRGLGVNNAPSGYTARMNLSQILETTGASGFTTAAGTSAYNFAKPAVHVKNCGREQMGFAETEPQGQGIEERKQLPEERQNQALLVRPHQHQQPLNFNSATVKDLFEEHSQNSDLSSGGTEFPGNIQLGSEFSGSINDLNALDTNLLFDPSQQQGQYEESPLEELKDDPIFQQICSETANSAGFDWLESKDQATVEMLG